jgi:hypothetical protein
LQCTLTGPRGESSPTRYQHTARTWHIIAPRSHRQSAHTHTHTHTYEWRVLVGFWSEKSSFSTSSHTRPFLSSFLKTRLKQRGLMQSSWQSGEESCNSFWQCIWQFRRRMTFSSVTGSGVMLLVVSCETTRATRPKRATRASDNRRAERAIARGVWWCGGERGESGKREERRGKEEAQVKQWRAYESYYSGMNEWSVS